MRTYVLPVAAGVPHKVFRVLADVLNSTNEPDRVLHAGYAYVTLGGVQALVSQVGSCPCWESLHKRFLIGIHHAITEPSAIEVLRGLPEAKVRVFLPGGRLSRPCLEAKPLFHSKVLALTTPRCGALQFLLTGSANLTSSAIGTNPKNYEFGIALHARAGQDLDRGTEFKTWWLRIWRQSKPVDRSFIRKYADLRKEVLKRNPILASISDVPATIGEARHFFAEVGAASGPPGSRHQIEFPTVLARFFGPVRRVRREIGLWQSGRLFRDRPLSHKRTTYDVDIWRLGMPTQNKGGVPIAERAVLFVRTEKRNEFVCEVEDVDSAVFHEWVSSANLKGHLGSTHGRRPRLYGFF